MTTHHSKPTSTTEDFHAIPKEVFHNLPAPLRQIAASIEGRIAKDIFLLGALPAVGACLPNVGGYYGRVRKLYSPHLFTCLLAEAASGKSTFALARRLVRLVDQRLREEYRKQQQEQQERQGQAGQPSVPQRLLIPGNTSAAALIQQFERNLGSGLIFEEETETLTVALGQEWGDFKDMLRKAAEHETISMGRSNGRYAYIPRPRLSLALSGTPRQILGLIDSVEDGLYSRFGFYRNPRVELWKSGQPTDSSRTLSEQLEEGAVLIDNLHRTLSDLPDRIDFVLAENHWKKLNAHFQTVHDRYIEEEQNLLLVSTIRRAAAMTFRIAMILSTLEMAEDLIENAATIEEIEPSDNAFNAAFAIGITLMEHGLALAPNLPDRGPKTRLAPITFRDRLPEKFTKAEANEIGEEFGLSERTVTNRLDEYVEKGYLHKPKKGYYIKA